MTSMQVSPPSVNYMKMKIGNESNLTVKSIIEFFENIKKKEEGFGGCRLLGQRF
jgi:hypothetical protein